MAGELTPMMVELRTMYVEARSEAARALEDFKTMKKRAGDLEDQCNRLYYRTILTTDGNPQTKKATAELETADLRLQLEAAKTLADAAEKAHRVAVASLNTVESLGHAYNRELKTLGG